MRRVPVMTLHPLQKQARAKGLLLEFGAGKNANYLYETSTGKYLPCPKDNDAIKARLETYQAPEVKA